MDELIFVVTPDRDGGFCAAAVGEGIFAQGDTWEELCAMALDATKCRYFESTPPANVRLILREQVLAVA